MRYEETVRDPDAGRRLDRFVSRMLSGAPQSAVQRLLRKGKVKVNGHRGHPGDRLASGDVVVVHHVAQDGHRASAASGTISAEAAGGPEELSYEGPPVELLHRSNAFLVVNKPAGVACHAPEPDSESLVAWARVHLGEDYQEGRVRPAPAHRLDHGTSGALALGLNAAALEAFRSGQTEGRVLKSYLVGVWGQVPDESFEIDLPLRRLPHSAAHRPKVVAARQRDGRVMSEDAKSARTAFRWLAAGPDASLLRAQPLTGRTHQIRAHLRAAGLPVVGDPRYGDPARDRAHGIERVLARQLLHAHRLAFKATPELGFELEAPLPPDCRAALKALELSF